MALALVCVSLLVASLAAVFISNLPFVYVDCSLSSFPRCHCNVHVINERKREQLYLLNQLGNSRRKSSKY